MAQQVVVKLVDDIDGSEAVETVTFGLDGRTYEIDLNDRHAEELRQALGVYLEHARRVGGSGSGRTRRSTAGGSAGGSLDNKAIRVWAEENGVAVPARGRIPRTVVEQWREATGG